jgi:hypothetical protein
VVLPEVWFLSHLEDEGMPQKKHKPEEIVAKLRQVDVLVSQGLRIGESTARNQPKKTELLPEKLQQFSKGKSR